MRRQLRFSILLLLLLYNFLHSLSILRVCACALSSLYYYCKAPTMNLVENLGIILYNRVCVCVFFSFTATCASGFCVCVQCNKQNEIWRMTTPTRARQIL